MLDSCPLGFSCRLFLFSLALPHLLFLFGAAFAALSLLPLLSLFLGVCVLDYVFCFFSCRVSRV